MTEIIEGEVWKDVVGYEGIYEVSNKGRIKSKHYGKEVFLKTQKTYDGYITIKLSIGGKSKRYILHRLVAIAFLDNPENKPQVNHIDCNKTNNFSDNLEWVTAQENVMHAWKNGLNGNTVYFFEKKIVEDYKNGMISTELTKKYKTSWLAIRKLLKKNGLEIITISERNSIYKFDKNELKKDFDNGMKVKDIAKKHKSSKGAIYWYKKRHENGIII